MVKDGHVAVVVVFVFLVNIYYLNDGMEEIVVVHGGRGGGSRNRQYYH